MAISVNCCSLTSKDGTALHSISFNISPFTLVLEVLIMLFNVVSENKILSHPASVDSIPSSANQEDHVSMGTIAAVKCRKILDNAFRVVATEILAACQAIDFRKEEKLGEGTSLAYNKIRENINFIEKDVIMYKELDKCLEIIKKDSFIDIFEVENSLFL